jgi:hypothetical protein
MRVRYETGIATFVQFVIGIGLSFVGSVASIIGGCRGHSGVDCASNTLVSLVLVILTVGAFGALLALGYAAQERRSSRLALILIGAEALAALIYLFDAKHSPGIIDRLTNVAGFAVAAWVIIVAVRLARSKGRRIVSAGRRPVIKP